MAADPRSTAADDSCGPIPARAGVGLRFQHHQAFLSERPAVAWLEVHTENYMGGGTPLALLEDLRRDYPLSLHGVGLSLGSAAGLDMEHVRRIAEVVRRVDPGLVSEHLSWSTVNGMYLADLMPLPLTEEALQVACRNVAQVQDVLGRRLLLENPSSYLQYRHSTIAEPEFLAAISARTGCGILCDVNNVYVSACNHGWDAAAYLRALPAAAVGEIHLAGHSVQVVGKRTLRIDDHGGPVCEAVWSLYRQALQCFGAVPTLIEWDNDMPPLPLLLDQAAMADTILNHYREPAHAVAA